MSSKMNQDGTENWAEHWLKIIKSRAPNPFLQTLKNQETDGPVEYNMDSNPSVQQETQNAISPSTGGTKFDTDKVRMELLPVYPLEQIAKVLSFGSKKYNSWNWTKGISFSRLQGASLRHLTSWSKGENVDKETGLSHLAHAGCCILFLLWMEKYRPDLDDRFKDPINKEEK